MKRVCRDCETVAEPRRTTQGSIWIELILWLCFLVPGLIYSIWRLSTRYDACAACGSKNIVPLNSPAGRKLAVELPPDVYQGSPRAEKFGRRLGEVFSKR